MKIMFKNQFNKIGWLAVVGAVLLVSCSDLEIKETDSIFAESGGGFNGVADPASSLTNLDNNIRGNIEGQVHCSWSVLKVFRPPPSLTHANISGKKIFVPPPQKNMCVICYICFIHCYKDLNVLYKFV